MKALLTIVAVLFLQLFSSSALASAMGYGERNCQINNEERGSLKGSDVCIQKISCERYPLSDPESVTVQRLVAYCRPHPQDSGRCPAKANECLQDESISAEDIAKIKPLPERPSIKPCGNGETPKGTATIVPIDSKRGQGGRK